MAMAQTDYFLKLDGIDGESIDAKHPNEIVLTSWGVGAANSASLSSATGAGAGKVTVRDFHFTKVYDKASPRLFVACCNGQHIKSATLTCRKAGAGQVEFLTVVLTNVIVTSYDVLGAADAGGVQDDQVTLGFARIELRYVQQSPTGAALPPITTGWDLAANKPV
jgi:type VI secretion system secreted protein Hcp